jgi:hypothetical protein
MDWKMITEFIGHSDVRTTYNRYGEVVPENLAPAAAQLDESLDTVAGRCSNLASSWGQRDRFQAAPPAPKRVKQSRNP